MGFCYKPLKGFLLGVENGKRDIKVCSSEVDYLIESRDGEILKVVDPSGDIRFNPLKDRRKITSFIEIPCGQCIGCKLQRSRVWADRIMCEALEHSGNYMLTLTYDNQNLPLADIVLDSGEVLQLPTLVKSDFQKFMKRLRKHFEPHKIRFYGIGEYGPKNGRPHFHIIVFGLPEQDLDFEIYKFNENSGVRYPLFHSATLDELWPFGFILAQELTWECAAYCARYVTSKVLDKKTQYEDLGLAEEFSLMSRRPGIGANFCTSFAQDFAQQKYKYISTPTGSRQIGINRYFRDKLEEGAAPSLDADLVKEFDDLSDDQYSFRKAISEMTASYGDYLSSAEINKMAVTKSLVRKGDFV